MDFEQTRAYWEQRASAGNSVQSTTDDVYLRKIEQRVLEEEISTLSTSPEPPKVLDIGCGDGRTTIALAKALPSVAFTGFDYAPAMVANAIENGRADGVKNASFHQHSVLEPFVSTYDIAYTTRCLINMPSWDAQTDAIRNIHGALSAGGHYLMVENFVEGQAAFNAVRAQYGLPEIAIRDHNLFFERRKLLEAVTPLFHLVSEVNVSSTYYLVSRVVYSRMCMDRDEKPNYLDPHHELASNLPFSGEYGPVRLLVFKKRIV